MKTSILTACRRPALSGVLILLGCVPLWTATGAGSVSRQIMGTTVIGGMLAATCIAIFIIPVLFVVVEKLATKGKALTVVTLVPPLPGEESAHGAD